MVVADLFVDNDDYWGVQRAVTDLQKDIQAVTGKKPELKGEEDSLEKRQFYRYSWKNRLIEELVKEERLEVER